MLVGWLGGAEWNRSLVETDSKAGEREIDFARGDTRKVSRIYFRKILNALIWS